MQNAKDARARGMKIFISLHHSDVWTHPSLHLRPAAGAGYSPARLETATSDYTTTALSTLRANGVTPDFVSIGNEINNALMDVNRWSDPVGYYALLKQASAAVRSASPASKIVIHLTTPDRTSYASWINSAAAYGLSLRFKQVRASVQVRPDSARCCGISPCNGMYRNVTAALRRVVSVGSGHRLHLRC